MDLIADLLLLAGIVLLPAVAIVVGGLLLGLLERFEPGSGEGPGTFATALAAVPYAALSAAMVLAPVVAAVWAVIAEEEAVAYLATVGFGLGALLLAVLADTGRPYGEAIRWIRMPGVVLSSAVGFFIALTSFLGGALARSLGVQVGDGWRVLVPILVALLVGGLALAAYRRRTGEDRQDRDLEASPTQNE